MKYRLGLDLGVGSIGSAVIELDNENNAKDIIDAGVRIFEVSEGAEERRLKRTARKNLVRTKKRLELLAKKLFENGLWPNENPERTDKLKSKSPYKIRTDALNEKLASPYYVGRAVLHIAKHRGAGFVSASEETEEEILEEGEKSKAKKSSYDMMLHHLKETNSKTIGEFFYNKIISGKGNDKTVRQKKYAIEKNIVDYAIPRYLVKDEFNKIWDKQAEFYPQMKKENLKKEIYDILFYERPAAPYATGKCIYFREEDRLLKAHPLSEMRRIYEEVNNIRILNDMNKRKLTLEERDSIVNKLLLKGQNAGKQAIKKLLNLSAQHKISLVDDRVIKAYLYSRPEFANNEHLHNMNENELSSFIEFLAEPKMSKDKNARLYNEDALIEYLKPILKIDDEKEIGNLLTKLPKGRGMLGISATKIILERLKEDVLTHREITDKLAETDKRFMAEEEIARQNQGKCFQLPYYGEILQTDTAPLPPLMINNNKSLNPDEIRWGKIANPAVHMILNQIRLVVNEIIKIYGKPYDINIELGRDVGMSTKKKKEFENQQKQNEKLNEEAKNYLKEHKIAINNKNILKYKLAKEQGWKDAYNPTQNISSIFTGMEIEHIIPQAKGGTDTYNNLCLVNSNDNLNKGDRYAYEYFEETKTQEEIREILKNARSHTPQKSWRFEADAREKYEESGDKEESTRYLTDTRYVAKMAQRYLRAIVDCSDCDKVMQTRILAVKGGQTAKLRQHWNLYGLEYDLMGLDIPRYVNCPPYWLELDTGEIIEGINKPDIDGKWKFFDKAKNKEWQPKPRIDHRHHAMDAITVACANRGLIQKMAEENDINKIHYPLPLTSVESLADFRRKVISCLKDIKVSHKPNHSKAGQFHKETARTVVWANPKDPSKVIAFYKKRILDTVKSINDIDKLLLSEKIKDEYHPQISKDRQTHKSLVDNFILHLDDARQKLLEENEKKLLDGKKETKITDTMILSKALGIIRKAKLWNSDKYHCYENNSSLVYISKHKITYENGNNHCVDFYVKDGKVGWEVIKRFDANQADFEPQWKKEGGKIIYSIYKGDILELDTPEKWKQYTDKKRCLAKVRKFSSGITIELVNDARDDKNIDKLPDRGLSFYLEHKARKVELTPFGKIKKKHKVLWNGSKTAA